MNITLILNLIFTFFAVLGGIDYTLDCRFGIGRDFERGMKCAASLFLCMAGFMTLSDWLGQVLSPLVTPFLCGIGADPSLIAGILLSVDSGGAVMAEEMALDPQAGILNGYFVSSMFGSAVMGNIALSILAVNSSRRREVLLGLAMGIASIPFGCALGGLLAGIRLSVIYYNMLPLLVLSLVLVLAMVFAGNALVRILKVFGTFNIALCVIGVIIAALGELCGIEILPSRMPFTEIMVIIGRIVLVLIGVFSCLSILLKLCRKPMQKIADRTGLSLLDVQGIPIDMINCVATIERLPEMSDMGIMLNCAFGIGAGYALGDHFAYVSSAAPGLAVPLIAGKLFAGAVSILLIVLFFRKKKSNGRDVPSHAKHRMRDGADRLKADG